MNFCASVDVGLIFYGTLQALGSHQPSIWKKAKHCMISETRWWGNHLSGSGMVLCHNIFIKATLVNICWPLWNKFIWLNENFVKSWFFAKFIYLQSQVYDIRSQQVLTKIIFMKSMRPQLSKCVSIIFILILDQSFQFGQHNVMLTSLCHKLDFEDIWI